MDDERRLAQLRDVAAGFDTHDVGRIIRNFAADAVFESPRGPARWGQRYEGTDKIAAAFQSRFDTIPDVRYRDDTHFVAGLRGTSEWTLTGTTLTGDRLDLHGCDLWTFRNGLIVKKDSFWKIRTSG